MNSSDRQWTDLKAGDLVRLKSGGPVMTVGGFRVGHEVPECLWISCHWFTDGHLHEAGFYSVELEAVSPSGVTLPSTP